MLRPSDSPEPAATEEALRSQDHTHQMLKIPGWLGKAVEKREGGGSMAHEGEGKEFRDDTGTLDPIPGGQRCYQR